MRSRGKSFGFGYATVPESFRVAGELGLSGEKVDTDVVERNRARSESSGPSELASWRTCGATQLTTVLCRHGSLEYKAARKSGATSRPTACAARCTAPAGSHVVFSATVDVGDEAFHEFNLRGC